MMKMDSTQASTLSPSSKLTQQASFLTKKKKSAQDERQHRLAAALRENLKKRKEQIRARQKQRTKK